MRIAYIKRLSADSDFKSTGRVKCSIIGSGTTSDLSRGVIATFFRKKDRVGSFFWFKKTVQEKIYNVFPNLA